MRRRWPEHCCPERHREDAAAQRALRGPSDASTHRNAAAGISQLSYSAHVVSSYLECSVSGHAAACATADALGE